MGNWPTTTDDPTSLPNFADGQPNVARASDQNENRRQLRELGRRAGTDAGGGGVSDGFVSAQPTPVMTVLISGIDSFYTFGQASPALTKTPSAPFTSPTATAPITNPYIGLLTVDTGGTFAW